MSDIDIVLIYEVVKKLLCKKSDVSTFEKV